MINKEYHKTEEQLKTEAQEIELAKKDPKKFGVLYDRYFEQIFRYVYQRLDDQDLAADICSQVFYKALVKLKDYVHKGVPFASWLYRIAFNELNMHFRKEAKNRTVNVETEGLGLMIEAFEIEEEDEHKKELAVALSQLPEESLNIVEMRFFEKRSFKEIGEILEITENNAKVKLYRTIDKLRKLIKVRV